MTEKLQPILCAADQLRYAQTHKTWEAAAQAAAGEISTEMATIRMSQEELARLIDTTIMGMAGVIESEALMHRRRHEFIGLAVAAVNGYMQVTGDRDALRTVTRTIAQKQHDYGHDNIARFGLVGLVVRLNDKAARLINLIHRSGSPAARAQARNEPLADTWLDICGYCVIALMWIDSTFLLPLAADA